MHFIDTIFFHSTFLCYLSPPQTFIIKESIQYKIFLLTGPASLMQTMKTLLLKGLAGSASGSNSNLKKSTLTAILTLITRPSLTEKHLSAMILHIFSVPGLVHHCGPDLCKTIIIKNGIFGQIIGEKKPNIKNDDSILGVI